MVEGMKGEFNRKLGCALGWDPARVARDPKPSDRVLTVLYRYYQAVWPFCTKPIVKDCSSKTPHPLFAPDRPGQRRLGWKIPCLEKFHYPNSGSDQRRFGLHAANIRIADQPVLHQTRLNRRERPWPDLAAFRV